MSREVPPATVSLCAALSSSILSTTTLQGVTPRGFPRTLIIGSPPRDKAGRSFFVGTVRGNRLRYGNGALGHPPARYLAYR